jgi:hypothetical protein
LIFGSIIGAFYTPFWAAYAGIELFLDWENGIWVAGTGIWPLGMGNKVLKNRNGIEVMRVDSQFFHVLSILKYNFDPFLVSLVMIFVFN